MTTNWWQTNVVLKPKPRGFHLIDAELSQHLKDMPCFEQGLLTLFLLHTSASLCINENACPDVRHDMEQHFNRFVPEQAPYYRHTLEGLDDMPAHIKSVSIGNNLIIPITAGQLNLGTWQGIYLGEHRNHAGNRTIVLTATGTLQPHDV